MASTGRDPAEVFAAEVVRFYAELQGDRVAAIEAVRAVELALRPILQLELARLQTRVEADDPRIRTLQDRIEEMAGVADALEVEAEIARVRPPEVAEDGAVLDGRVVDERMHGVLGARVRVLAESGRDLGIAPVTTDASGYYAVPLPREVLEKVAGERVVVTVDDPSTSAAPVHVQAVEPRIGVRTTSEVILPGAAVERVLGLAAGAPAARARARTPAKSPTKRLRKPRPPA